MNEQEPRSGSLPDEPEGNERRNQEALEGLVQHFQQAMDDENAEGTPRQKLLSLAEQSIRDNFSDRKESFADYLAWLRNDKDTSNEELAREAAERWYEAVQEQFFLDDNHAIGYTVHGDKLALHVQRARDLSTKGKVESIRQALTELALRLRTQDDLSGVKEITATSWIVSEKPSLVKRLGFTIDDPVVDDGPDSSTGSHDEEVGTARISVEDFLNRYTDEVE